MPGRGAGQEYWLAQIEAERGGLHQIVVSLSGMGNDGASIRATRMLEYFHSVENIIMTGIAGGAPYPEKHHHVRLSDIVVSKEHGVVSRPNSSVRLLFDSLYGVVSTAKRCGTSAWGFNPRNASSHTLEP